MFDAQKPSSELGVTGHPCHHKSQPVPAGEDCGQD